MNDLNITLKEYDKYLINISKFLTKSLTDSGIKFDYLHNSK